MKRHKSIYDAAMIELPKIFDDRGNLTFIESMNHIPFEVKRVYWIYDVPGGESRGVYDEHSQKSGHAYRELKECIIALSGSFEVVLDDGEAQKTITLNRAYYGLYVPPMIWRRLQNFSTNSVAFILASENFDEGDYIRDYRLYKQYLHEQ